MSTLPRLYAAARFIRDGLFDYIKLDEPSSRIAEAAEALIDIPPDIKNNDECLKFWFDWLVGDVLTLLAENRRMREALEEIDYKRPPRLKHMGDDAGRAYWTCADIARRGLGLEGGDHGQG